MEPGDAERGQLVPQRNVLGWKWCTGSDWLADWYLPGLQYMTGKTPREEKKEMGGGVSYPNQV